MTGGFTFRGVHSSRYGVHMQAQGRTLLPPRREGSIVIPGESGCYDGVGGRVYDTRSETFQCGFAKPAGMSVPEVCRELAYWLSGTGRLVLDKEPDKYYLARLSGAPPMEQHLHYGAFTLTWVYNPPFAFGRTVTLPVRDGANAPQYQGTAETPCLLVLRNTSGRTIQNITITAIKRSGL